nr:MAG TPA: hypothetical protein [Caudoviricetes sp.]
MISSKATRSKNYKTIVPTFINMRVGTFFVKR